MSCIELLRGQDNRCGVFQKKYAQQIILINKSDIDSFQRISSNSRHVLRFILKEGKGGFLFATNDKGNSVNANFSKEIKEGIPQYKHSVSFLLMGVDEDTKLILKELDNSFFFACTLFSDNTIEVYGFDFGLNSDYEYAPQDNAGGSIINLVSETLENEPPYVYQSGDLSTGLEDWDNLFLDNPPLPSGDFNNDFNNDFHI